jgi:hypothetical protein
LCGALASAPYTKSVEIVDWAQKKPYPRPLTMAMGNG